MQNIFEATDYQAPYTGVKFPGQAEDERILYITRESPVMLAARLTGFFLATAVAIVIGAVLVAQTGEMLNFATGWIVGVIMVLGLVVMFGGLWWGWQVYRKTLFIITTRRLTKFIHTTPWTRYQMSLTLDKVVDSAAYSKGYLQAIFKLGTFVARSSAGNIKNFKIVNIQMAEDLHNWMNKLIFTFNKEKEKLDQFRAFAMKKTGERY
jgi:hypothetical protein